ncbi:methyltransferase [Nonomuraea sp. NPDC050404]|uniref:methyltransferase n=1 Tax=Nonomuraea sp. NPDC050404 TaxID=3155783 RepID=UPI0033E8233B
MSHPNGPDPTGPVWELIRGVWRFAALYALVRLEVPQALKEGPRSAEELARHCGAEPAMLARVLRSAAGLGLLRSASPGAYELTETGAVLLPDHPRSLHPGVLTTADPAMMYALMTLTETVRTGEQAFVGKYGPLYRHLAQDRELAAQFDAFMDARSRPFARALAERYDFSGARTIADVGGGKGHILATILRAHPHLRGVVVELEHTAPAARAYLAGRGVGDRAGVITGDFFASVPIEADLYLLSNVIHNWDDPEAIKIIENLLAVMPDSARILFVDMVLPDDDSPHMGKELDMRMLGVFGSGRERSLSEYTALLRQAGLEVTDVAELALSTSVIETVRA